MNGIDKITERITREAILETDAVITDVRAKAEKLLEARRAEADTLREDILRRGRERAADQARRLSGLAALEARKLELLSKQEMISLAFSRALKKMKSMPESEYIAFLAKIALRNIETGTEEILLPSEDQPKGETLVSSINAALVLSGKKAGITLSPHDANVEGGFILRSGDVELNCGFDTTLRVMRDELSVSVAATLFGSGE